MLALSGTSKSSRWEKAAGELFRAARHFGHRQNVTGYTTPPTHTPGYSLARTIFAHKARSQAVSKEQQHRNNSHCINYDDCQYESRELLCVCTTGRRWGS